MPTEAILLHIPRNTDANNRPVGRTSTTHYTHPTLTAVLTPSSRVVSGYVTVDIKCPGLSWLESPTMGRIGEQIPQTISRDWNNFRIYLRASARPPSLLLQRINTSLLSINRAIHPADCACATTTSGICMTTRKSSFFSSLICVFIRKESIVGSFEYPLDGSFEYPLDGSFEYPLDGYPPFAIPSGYLLPEISTE